MRESSERRSRRCRRLSSLHPLDALECVFGGSSSKQERAEVESVLVCARPKITLRAAQVGWHAPDLSSRRRRLDQLAAAE